MKPMIVLPPKLMSDKDVQILRDNGLCVVIAQDPSKVRFVDPIPASSARTEIENAAIQLSRKVLNPNTWKDPDYVKNFTSMFVEILIAGTPLSSGPTQKEKEDSVYNAEKMDMIRKMAREDAKSERDAKKAAEAAAKTKTSQPSPQGAD